MDTLDEAHLFWMYGWGGPWADPGSGNFAQRANVEIPGLNIHGSPYIQSRVNDIVAEILELPATAIVLVGGTSLGCCNTPVVSQYLYYHDKKRIIHGAFGFQKSIFGADVGFAPNVLFAQYFRSVNPLPFPGLGSGKWWSAEGNTVTNIHPIQHNVPHPGDGVLADQLTQIATMKRVIAAARISPLPQTPEN